MIIIKDNVKDVLRRVMLEEVARSGTFNVYSKIKEQLLKLDISKITRYAKYDNNAPLCWRKEEYTQVLNVGNYKFAYRKHEHNDTTLVLVDEVAEKQGNTYQIVNENLSNNYANRKRLYESIMRDVSKIVKIHLKQL